MTARTSLALDERTALCDTALDVGPDAPTLAGEWTVQDLLCHLLVRERNPVGALGIRVAPLAGLTERAMARLARRPLDVLVEDFRTRPRLSPLRVPGVDRVFNTLEFFVHHEDIRRAQPAWAPRALDDGARDALWDAISTQGKLMVRPAGVPVTVRRTDTGTDTGATAVLRGGDDPVVVAGPPAEVVLFLFGRAQHQDLDFAGPADAVRRLRDASLGA